LQGVKQGLAQLGDVWRGGLGGWGVLVGGAHGVAGSCMVRAREAAGEVAGMQHRR
jgi:hypothetical protein